MSTFAAMKARLASFASQEGTGSVDLDYALRNHTVQSAEDVTAAGKEVTLVNVTKFAANVVSASFCPETGVVGAGASLSARLFHDDGAGGGPVALCTLWNGVTETSVDGQVSAFAGMLVGVDIPLGSRIYVDVTVNGAGAAWDETGFELEYAET